MATIYERKRDSKVISFKFTVFMGRDESGKQLFKATTWKPPEGLTYAKARKMAESQAYLWEQEIQGNSIIVEQIKSAIPAPAETALEAVQTAATIPDEETFRYFAESVWLPLKVIAGGARPSTIAMYKFMLRVALPVLGGKRLTEITAVDIMKYLQYLRDDYRAPDGRTLSEKSVKHHYDILRIIFNYAEKQEAIEKNPIKKVDAPKTTKRPVDALTQEQAKIFFDALAGCKLEYRCMMLLMATTGIRRGECLGLQWRDFDFDNNTLHISRNTTYTKESGTVVAEPKTPCTQTWCYLDTSSMGLIVFPSDYAWVTADTFENGRARVRTCSIKQNGELDYDNMGYYGIIDKDGKYIISPKYDLIMYLDDNSESFLIKSDDKYGLMNKDGNTILAMVYEKKGTTMKCGRRMVKLGSRYGYVNESGNEVMSCIYEDYTNFDEQTQCAAVKTNGEWCVIDTFGNVKW